MRGWRIALAAFSAGVLLPTFANAQGAGINPLPLIIQDESSGNPAATSKSSTASGLAGDVNGTWQAALTACGGACGTAAQFPTAASAPASIQVAANNALINSQGLQPWLCSGCDPTFAAQVAAAGGRRAFQTSGLDTNPADFAALDTTAGLNSFLAGTGTPLSTGGLGASPTGLGTSPSGIGTSPTGLGLSPTGSGGAPTSTGGSALGGGILDDIVLAFQSATQGWQAGLFNTATHLFWILATIDLIAALIMLVIGGGRPDWSDVVFTILRWTFPVGLFLWLMNHASQYSQAIIDSLRQAANAAGGAAITPSAILTAGINAASTIWTQFASLFHPVTMMALMLAALVIVICFCLMATWMAAALIEGYFVVGTSVLLLAFGGMRWSREIGVALLRFCLAIGMKLFAISMIVAVGNTFVQQWTLIPQNISIQALFVIVGASVFLAAMAKVVPDTMQRIILAAPVSLAHYNQVTHQAAGTAALAAAPVLATAGFTALAIQAFQQAAERLATNSEQPDTAIGRAGQMALGMGRSVASAAGSEISGRLGGLYRGGTAASAARMASRVAQTRRVDAAQQTRPQPPAGNNNP